MIIRGAYKDFVIQFKNAGSIAAAFSTENIEALSKNTVNVYNSETNELVKTLELSESNLFISSGDIALGDTDGTIYDDNYGD